MNRWKYLVGAAAAVFISAGAAVAAPIYADSVISFVQGPCTGGCLPARSDATKALGAPDGDFVALGFGGELELGFPGTPYAAATATTYEITFVRTAGHDEAVEVYSSLLGVLSPLLGVITNTPTGTSSVFVGGPFDAIVLKDITTTVFPGTTSFDGFDVDAVSIDAVPLPAAGFMLLAGLGGLAMARRKS